MSKQEMPAFYHSGVEVSILGDAATRPVFTIDVPTRSLDIIAGSAPTRALIGHIGEKLGIEEQFAADGGVWGFGGAGSTTKSRYADDWTQVRFAVPERSRGYLNTRAVRDQHMPVLGSMQVIFESLNHGIKHRTGLPFDPNSSQYMTVSLALHSGVAEGMAISGSIKPPVLDWLEAIDTHDRHDEANATAATMAHVFDAASPWPNINAKSGADTDMLDMIGFDAELAPKQIDLGVRTGRAALTMGLEGGIRTEHVARTNQLLGLFGGVVYLTQRAMQDMLTRSELVVV